MRDLKNNLTTSGKGSTNIQSRKGKSFGYQVLGFGAGGGVVSYDANYLIIAGGGSTGHASGGGGAGGYRTSFGCGPEAACTTQLTFEAGCYTIDVGAGAGAAAHGAKGSNTNICGTGICFSSTGGGNAGGAGGSGGGGALHGGEGGAGNQGGYTPVEGYAGGTAHLGKSSGGGGAGGVGQPGDGNNKGGIGLASCITASCVTRGSGGSGADQGQSSNPAPAGGGGTGTGQAGGAGQPGTANTGGGGGDGGPTLGTGGNGGSGIVLVRFPSCATVSVAPGTNSVAACVGPSNDKVATFTVDGTLTVA